MTAEELATLHARAFTNERAWSASEFADLLGSYGVILCGDSQSFILAREIAGESEILTLATDPSYRRQGLAKKTLRKFIEEATSREVSDVFLEVSEANSAATSLYLQAGFEKIGRRKKYYHHLDGTIADAIVMKISLHKPLL